MNEKFEEWLSKNYGELTELAFEDGLSGFPWSMQWGVYQKYFWETKSWWLSIYPYTDKFGGRIDKFWDEGQYKCNFITNVPEQAQKRLVEAAFKLEDENK